MTVLRIKKTENFVTIHTGALNNPNLSFKAKGLWAYCMSRPNDWSFHVNHLATVSREKKDAIYSAIKELEANGYIKKIQKNENGSFGPVDYEVYETPELKEILPQRDFPQTEVPQTENPPLVNIDTSLNIDVSLKQKPKKEKPSISEEAYELSKLLFKGLLSLKSDFKGPNFDSWAKTMQIMIRIDKRSPEAIKRIIHWLPASWWGNKIINVEKLRERFDQLELEMGKKPNHKTPSNSTISPKKEMPVEIPKEVREAWKKPNAIAIEMEKMEKERQEKLQSKIDTSTPV